MKKTIILIIIALSTAAGCWAQEAEKNDSALISRYQARRTMRGMKMIFEGGYQWGLHDGSDDSFFIDSYWPNKTEITVSVGYQFNNFAFLGGGVGAQMYRSAGNTYLVVPVFGEFRLNFLNAKRVTPFIDLRAGYGIGDMGGVYSGCQLGVRIALPHRHAVTLVCQFDGQVSLGSSERSDFENDCLGFKVGYEF